ncbi:YccS family putative transporter [Pseudoxanthomonas sp.]|uniref:YccS family putative transporter n=1 Tax=Pseudoxanthomonas sp. TaxID=1871049 RepID=UPI002624036D|nr:YccS family putative transporter [Pseudoxanthomonas sp.]WDS38122.1 MAG: YccS family putative transporter [Pseudoxanthomonas sp.]
MHMPTLESRLNQLWAHEKASYGLRVLIALATVMGLCWYHDALHAIPTLFLGIIASALAETDDNWWGRSKSVLLSLLCFGLGAGAVVVLFSYPWPFVTALAVATFALTLLGALGERYASITQATVAISIYCMIGLDASGGHATGQGAWRGVGLLMAGATWYGVLSIAWAALFANRPVRERLARLLFEVGQFLRLKASLFEPVRENDRQRQRLALAEQNAKVVAALNAAKTAILSRFGRSGRPGVQSGLYFRLYYMAQDFHERASSSHYPYDALTNAFFHSDVLYRCQRLLALQGVACRRLGEALRLRQPFVYGEATHQAMTDLDQSLDFLRGHSTPEQLRLLGSLDLLGNNLQNIERQLSEAARSDSTLDGIDTRLRDSNPHTLKEMAQRVRQQLTPKSLLFRHGLRMAIALAASYGVMKLLHAHSGYWILLTTAFVCRPNYGATRLRLVQRIAGTLIGLGFTWAFMQLFPVRELQLLLALLGALVFFITRTDRYVMATAAITVMALLCFNLIGDGFLLLWPRLIDTVVGCVIAAAAAFLILPDWQTNRIHLIIASIVDACRRYLDEVMNHYLGKGGDDLSYRIARRDMHNADAALSASLSGMLRDPRYMRRNLDAGFRFLALSNTLLSYLSALGAHRATLPQHQDDALLEQARDHLDQALTGIHAALLQRDQVSEDGAADDEAMGKTLEQMPEDINGKLRLVRTQLALVTYMLPQLRAATNAIALAEPSTSPGDDAPRHADAATA